MQVKVCDFGNAMYAHENEETPYQVSRYYRPPEVIIGLRYSFAMDTWALACVIYELYTSQVGHGLWFVWRDCTQGTCTTKVCSSWVPS